MFAKPFHNLLLGVLSQLFSLSPLGKTFPNWRQGFNGFQFDMINFVLSKYWLTTARARIFINQFISAHSSVESWAKVGPYFSLRNLHYIFKLTHPIYGGNVFIPPNWIVVRTRYLLPRVCLLNVEMKSKLIMTHMWPWGIWDFYYLLQPNHISHPWKLVSLSSVQLVRLAKPQWYEDQPEKFRSLEGKSNNSDCTI